MNTPLERNKMGVIIIDKAKSNDGKIDIPLVDDRFILDDFSYVVDIGFKDLPQAVNAEDYVLRRYADALQQAKDSVDSTITNLDTVEKTASEEFYSDLNNIINENENSMTGVKSRLNQLQEDLVIKDEIILSKDEQITSQFLEIDLKNQEIARKDAEIEQLRGSVQSIAAATTQSLQKIEDLSMKQTEQLVNTLNTITKKS